MKRKPGRASVAFTLSMPRNSSWNGKWSGAERTYVVVRSYSRAKAEEIAERVSYSYDFGDGWMARVSVAIVEGQSIRALRRASQGFCGYDWMIDSIERHGAIYTSAPAVAT